jgi:uncharacterized membrane protein
LTITLVDFLVIIPHFSPTGIDPFAARYSGVGTTPGGILHTALAHPLTVLEAVATTHKLLYVVLLLGPFLGLWAREPLIFLGAVPDLAINLLSNKTDQTVIAYHWTAGIVPFTVAASVMGAAKLKRDRDSTSLAALLGAALIAVVSPITLGIIRGDPASALSSSAVRSAKAHAIGIVPSQAPVAASNDLAAYVADRRYVYVYPLAVKAAWLVVDRNDDSYADQAGYKRSLRRLDASRKWRVIYSSNGIQVLQRTRSSDADCDG